VIIGQLQAEAQMRLEVMYKAQWTLRKEVGCNLKYG